MFWLCIVQINGQVPDLVKDFNTIGESSNPENIIGLGADVYFTAESIEYGRELYRLSNNKVYRLTDLNPGSNDTEFGEFYVVDKDLYFSADNGISGMELWIHSSDKTNLIKDVNIGMGDSDPAYMTFFEGEVYFVADDGQGRKIWKTQGEKVSTVKLTDKAINNSDLYEDPFGLLVFNRTLYFAADEANTGVELYRTNGIEVQRTSNFAASADGVFSDLFVFGDDFYFVGDDGVLGEELWSSSGGLNDATLVKDINNNGDSFIEHFTLHDDHLFFSAYDTTHGAELWKTDGNITELVKDIRSGSSGSAPSSIVSSGENLFFNAYYDFYVSDGTDIGTFELSYREVDEMVAYNNGVYFSAFGLDLGYSDGTIAGTIELDDFSTNIFITSPASEMAVANDVLYFSANDGLVGRELWSNIGTVSSTLAADVDSTTKGVSRLDYIEIEGNLIVSANGLWSINNGSQPVLLSEVQPATPILEVGDKYIFFSIYFDAYLGLYKIVLWHTEGTIETTIAVDTISNSVFENYIEATVYNDTLYYSYYSDIYKSDGCDLGVSTGINIENNTIIAGDIYSLGGVFRSSELYINGAIVQEDLDPEEFGVFLNDKVFFTADSNVVGRELWRTDGTEEGTTIVKDINPFIDGSSNPMDLFKYESEIFFSADNGTEGRELWKTDGTTDGTILVKDLDEGASSGNPRSFVLGESSLYFVSDNSQGGMDVWRSDGSQGGTVLYINIPEALDIDEIYYNVDGKLYLNVQTAVHGYELWVSDGSQSGTLMIHDLNPGEYSSAPESFYNYNGTLYFSAVGSTVGRELYQLSSCPENVERNCISGPCELEGNILAGNTIDISGDHVIKSNKQTRFSAPVSIVFNEGFHVEALGDLEVDNQGCDQ